MSQKPSTGNTMRNIFFIASFVLLSASPAFANNDVCGKKLKSVAAHLANSARKQKIKASVFNVGELTAYQFSVYAQLSDEYVGYVVSTGEECEIIKVCKSKKGAEEICYDE